MKINFQKNFNQESALLLIPCLDQGQNIPEFLKQWVSERVKSQQFSYEVGEHVSIFSSDEDKPAHSMVWSFGKAKEVTNTKIRSTLAKAIKHLRHHPVSEISIMLNADFLKYAQEIGEALALSNYNPAIYKTGKDREEAQTKIIQKINIIAKDISRVQKYDLEEGLKIGLAVNQVRDLVNGPHNLVNVKTMTDKAKEIAAKNKYGLKILDKKQLEKLQMGALLGVNQGSHEEAKLIVLEYLPLGKRQEPTAIVGKGVVFDSGGVNIKPTQGLSEMHMDMAGGAAVLGVFSLLKELEINQNVIGLIPLTDNSVDATSLKPSDIVTSYSGKTIEIGNTDAEGRLILCDAISYAIRTYQPSQVIDIATLTGACMVALGDQLAGMFGNNKRMKERMLSAAHETNEEIWEMPIHESHRKAMKGKFADLNNISDTGLGGACTAAAFLEEFVEKTDWIHLDIAGPAMPKKPQDIDFPGGTGFGVRLLTRFLQNIK